MTPIDLMADDRHVGVLLTEVLGDGGGAVGRTVVDDQHLDVDAALLDDRSDARREVAAVVVTGDDDAERPPTCGHHVPSTSGAGVSWSDRTQRLEPALDAIGRKISAPRFDSAASL